MKLLISIVLCVSAFAQNNPGTGSTTVPTQTGTPYYTLIPISITGSVGATATLTIPAPVAGLYNYVCSLSFTVANSTGTASINAATTSTNFNSFGIAFSNAATANLSYTWQITWGSPATGCVKSLSPQTATTFVSPSLIAAGAYVWQATYYQAP